MVTHDTPPDTVFGWAHWFEIYEPGGECFPMDPDCWDCSDDEFWCHEEYRSGTCEEVTQACHSGGFPDDGLDALLAARSGADLEGIAALVAKYSSSLRINRERKSIQIANCASAIIGNLPLPPTLLNAVIAAATPGPHRSK
jgi:hypothetical protein